MSSSPDQSARGPLGVAPSDEKPEGWCEVICVIPELKVKKSLSGGKIVEKPATGDFDHHFATRSLSFHVECKTKSKKTVKYAYKVKELPGDILPNDSKIKWKEGKVVLKLKKVDSTPWERALKANGLEQAEEDDDIATLE